MGSEKHTQGGEQWVVSLEERNIIPPFTIVVNCEKR